MSELPERVAQRVQQEERTERALERIVAEPVPANETPQQRLTREWNQQAAAEAGREQRVTRALHEDPDPPLEDPFRTFAQAQQQARNRRRRGR